MIFLAYPLVLNAGGFPTTGFLLTFFWDGDDFGSLVP
jgi:hypothetical protein